MKDEDIGGVLFFKCCSPTCGPGSSVGIATGFGLDGPGIESRWGARYFAPVQTGPGAHPVSCTTGKVTAVPLQARRGPGDSRKLRVQDFVTTVQDGGRLSALRTGRF